VLLNQRGEENKKGNRFMDNTAKDIYYLLPNGKCPHCGAQIRVIDSESTVYKTRLLKMVRNGRTLIKCPDCRRMIIVD